MSLAILFHFLCAQHVSDINISIIRSLRLFCWITTLVVLFLVPHRNSNTHRTKNNTTNVVIQNSRKLLMMDILMSETRWSHKKWNKIASDIKLAFILQLCAERLQSDPQYSGCAHSWYNCRVQVSSWRLWLLHPLQVVTCSTWRNLQYNLITRLFLARRIYYLLTTRRLKLIDAMWID